MKNILSLFDYTGNWPKPYSENGYNVIVIDIQKGIDILKWDYKQYSRDYFYGIFSAVPCTDFALCGARWFEKKDTNGETDYSISLVKKSLEIIEYFSEGLQFFVTENPASRIHKLVPELGEIKFKFNPFQFAQYDPEPKKSQYGKVTWLWGKFNNPIKKELPCLLKGMDRHSQWGGRSLHTKNMRSATPMGFAYAFYESNK